MKNLLIVILLMVVIAIASILHVNKKPADPVSVWINTISKSLEPVKKILPERSNISFSLYNAKSEVFLWARYVLAPRYASVNEAERFDTSLIICGINSTDSLLQSVTNNRRIIWHGTDSLYHYFLSCAQ